MLDTELPPTVESPAAPTEPGSSGDELLLMMGDEPVARTGAGTNVGAGDAFMGNHKTTKLNPQPGAVLVPGGAYSTPMTGQTPSAPTTPQPSASPPPQQQFLVVVGFDRGFEHASGCFSQNSGPTCSSAAPDRIDGCITDYNAGYSAGDTQRRLRVMDAYRAGAADAMLGRVSNGAGLPDAVGTCRINIIQAYNSGFQGAPPPP